MRNRLLAAMGFRLAIALTLSAMPIAAQENEKANEAFRQAIKQQFFG